MIKIGNWDKTFDIATLLFQACVFLALFVATLYNFDLLGLLLIYLGIAGFHTARLAKSNYVYYEQGAFVIDRLFRRSKVIKGSLFYGVGRSPFAIPLSNTIVISFRTGDEITIRGGATKMEDIEVLINKLIKGDGSNE